MHITAHEHMHTCTQTHMHICIFRRTLMYTHAYLHKHVHALTHPTMHILTGLATYKTNIKDATAPVDQLKTKACKKVDP